MPNIRPANYLSVPMRSPRERNFYRVFAAIWTLFLLPFDILVLISVAARLRPGGSLRGSDLIVTLFLVPFHLVMAQVWLKVFHDRVPSAWKKAARARRRELATSCVVGMGALMLAMAWAMTRSDRSWVVGLASWLGVLGASFAGYRLSPHLDWLRRRGNDRPRIPLPPLPARRRASGDRATLAEMSWLDNQPVRPPATGVVNTEFRTLSATSFVARPGRYARPAAGLAGVIWIAAMLGAISLLFANLAGHSVWEIGFWVVLLSLGCVAGLWLLYLAIVHDGSLVFDLQHDEVSYALRLSRKTRPLSDIIAVQFLMIAPEHIKKSRDEGGQSRCMFQINLVTADPLEPRIPVICHANSRWSHDAARALATGLNIPFIDGVFSPGELANRQAQ